MPTPRNAVALVDADSRLVTQSESERIQRVFCRVSRGVRIVVPDCIEIFRLRKRQFALWFEPAGQYIHECRIAHAETGENCPCVLESAAVVENVRLAEVDAENHLLRADLVQ